MLLQALETFAAVYVAYNLLYFLAISTIFTLILLGIRNAADGYSGEFKVSTCFKWGYGWPLYLFFFIISAILEAIKGKKK